MSPEVGQQLLDKLDAAERALPPPKEPKPIFPF
jgi:hypothetical protein